MKWGLGLIYTVTSTLPPNHGGRTKALLKRIQFIYDALGIKQTILTTNYNIEYPEVLAEFREKGILNKDTQVINLYDWLSGYDLFNIPKTTFKKEKKYKAQPVALSNYTTRTNKKGDIVRYYDKNDETYLLYRKFYEDSEVVHFEDVMTPGVKHKVIRYEYNTYGYLHKKTYYAARKNMKVSEMMYDLDGNIYCQKWFEENKQGKPEATSILIYRDGRVVRSFTNDKALFAYFYNEMFKDGDIVFNDARLLDEPLIDNQHAIKPVLVFHSSHLTGDNIKGSYRYAIDHHENIAKYIVLTTQQKQDILAQSDVPEHKIQVIPHFIEPSTRPEQERKNQFVYLGRFSKEKRIDHIVKAFKLFKAKGYDTKLKLYGGVSGPEQEEIKNLISKEKLAEVVEIEPFTNHPKEVFRESRASILTSTYEGFGLSMMESINEGCPVLAYDIRYGPNEIIEEGENGYLIPTGDIEALAQAMERIITHPLQHVQTRQPLTPQAAQHHFEQLFKTLI